MPTKWEKVKEKATADILDAASLEFAENGYNGAKIMSIASRAGVSNGLICKYFDCKEKLLCAIIEHRNLRVMFDSTTETEPDKILDLYINNVKQLQTDDPCHFRLLLRIVSDTEFPDSVYVIIQKNFRNSLLENAIVQLQNSNDLGKGDPFELFKRVSSTLYILLNHYAIIGKDAPDNDAILAILGYNRREKEYREQSAMMSRMQSDLGLLLSAIRENYPLSISSNLNANTYHMIDYDRYSTRKADEEGTFDDLVQCGASTIPDEEQRRLFTELFDRKNLLHAFENGEKERSLVHLQTGDDGVDRWISTRCMMKQNPDGTIQAITIGGAIDSSIKRTAPSVIRVLSQEQCIE